jgi:hypothetical protein
VWTCYVSPSFYLLLLRLSYLLTHYCSLEWQHDKRHGLNCRHQLDRVDLTLARDLVHVLTIFHEITLQLSISGSSRLSNIVVYIDQVTEHLSTVISDKNYPPAMRNACRLGLKLTNKYYSLTDISPLYRIAIRMYNFSLSFTEILVISVLHPSFKDEYFKLANWEPEWIAEAIHMAQEMWVSFYKPRSPTPTTASKVSYVCNWMLYYYI